MALTQDVILSFLLSRNGKAKNSEFLSEFKGLLNCSDLAEKKENRELFKTFVNHVAVVKEIDGEKHIVLKKKYAHLLKEIPATTDQRTELGESSNVSPDTIGEQRRPFDGKVKEGSDLADKESSNFDYSNVSSPLLDVNCDGCNLKKEPSAVEQALQRWVDMDASRQHITGTQDITLIRPCKTPQVNSLNENETHSSVLQDGCIDATHSTGATAPQKPFMLPLRIPPTHPVITDALEANAKNKSLGTVEYSQDLDKRSPGAKRRLFEGIQTPTSPPPRRILKNSKSTEEPKYSASVPLESTEHEWLVKSAAGQWSQVHGLLLQDAQLALKKDFISGFTALHWAAKGGNCEMVRTIIELCQQHQADFDINAKSHGGYTALHIAAIHDRQPVMDLLVRDHGANVHVRDNNGKKAYHYLRKDASEDVRDLLGDSTVLKQEPMVQEKPGDDHFAEISKGLSTIGRLFQPHGAGLKKKLKSRPGLQTTIEDMEDEDGEGLPKNQSFSDSSEQGLMPH